ncbi:phosphotransferase enzyme family protein [Burkholderia gladioli]|uniref:phosphotransferase enzyme family protein n=1 Tax=Burkholderia gladioli TaxID=28095 RepID=UPI00163F3D92|nr:phosphotransferase [Burkholderia gladioli]MBU9198002.1 phosphotransferase [Burkholderia gladioli]MDN7917822.1 phosphotransferase [Burkholderia gladioli]
MDLARLSHLFGHHIDGAVLVQDGINKIYRIEKSGAQPRYLRLFRRSGRSREEIDFELHLLHQLPDMVGVAVARPLPNVDGALLSEVLDEDETRLACMFEAAEGWVPKSDVSDMKQLGQALAILHEAARRVPLPFSRPMDPSATIRDSIRSLEKIGATGLAIAQQIERECTHLPSTLTRSTLPFGPCHGDVWAGNVRMLDEKVTFFDFDECGFGPYVMDLATPAWHLIVQKRSEAGTLWNAFLGGYESQRQLHDAEKEVLPCAIMLRHISSLLSLARFCTLPEALWIDTADRTHSIISGFKGANPKFGFL